MNKSFILRISLLTLLVLTSFLLTGCRQERIQEYSKENLETRFKENSSILKTTIKNSKTPIWDNLSGFSEPTLTQYLIELFNADIELSKNKIPKYKDFNGEEYNKYLLDDGFVAISSNFYIIINNDFYNPQNIQLYIDTNGKQGPNKMGYDLFKYNLVEGDKLEPIEKTIEAENNPDYFKTLL